MVLLRNNPLDCAPFGLKHWSAKFASAELACQAGFTFTQDEAMCLTEACACNRRRGSRVSQDVHPDKGRPRSRSPASGSKKPRRPRHRSPSHEEEGQVVDR